MRRARINQSLSSLVVVAAAVLAGCGGKDGKGGEDDKDAPEIGGSETDSGGKPRTGFFAPSYAADAGADLGYGVALTDTTAYVAELQTRGSRLAQRLASAGKLTLEDGQVIELVAIARADCPPELTGCAETDSAKLGVGPGAMVVGLEAAQGRVRQQGDRGTCVAFSLSAAVEILDARANGTARDLSEQYTYFQGKRATSTWDSSGLVPAATLQRFVDDRLRFAPETAWPYNPRVECDPYNEMHPGFACSETEAQGAGSGGRDPEPQAVAAKGPRLVTVHQLYASLGRIKQALHRGYPVVLGVNANSDFAAAGNKLKKGVVSWIFKQSQCDGVCGHAVVAIGYQDDASVAGGGYVVIRNSWGGGWGDSGVAYLTYEWLQNSLLDAQAVVAMSED